MSNFTELHLTQEILRLLPVFTFYLLPVPFSLNFGQLLQAIFSSQLLSYCEGKICCWVPDFLDKPAP